MKILSAFACLAVALVVATGSLLAHEVTTKGTVLTVAKENVTITVVDPKTKQSSSRVFFVDEETKVLRDGVAVTLATAKMQKGENISVTVDHDLDEELAQVIRLGIIK